MLILPYEYCFKGLCQTRGPLHSIFRFKDENSSIARRLECEPDRKNVLFWTQADSEPRPHLDMEPNIENHRTLDVGFKVEMWSRL